MNIAKWIAASVVLGGLSVNAAQAFPVLHQEGYASWYGPGFLGRRTASGERFTSGELTAAHRYLPLGSRVRVTNMSNGRSVVVRINDRGPYCRGRIIDLSFASARAIGMSGLARVQLAQY